MHIGTLIFILLIPVIAALGFDAYIYYENQEEGFILTDLGWVWNEYFKESHDYAYQQVGKEQWTQYVRPVLELPLVAAALIFSGIILFVIFLVKALSSISSGKFSPKRNQKSLGRDRGAGKEFKYKRR